jgi:hypothetical protein
MGSSLGFGSFALSQKRAIHTRFPYASVLADLDKENAKTRWVVLQKVRRHPASGAPTLCKYMVSGTISLPLTGYFSPFPRGTSSLSVILSI